LEKLKNKGIGGKRCLKRYQNAGGRGVENSKEKQT